MARVIMTFNIMPESPDVDLEKVESAALEKIKAFTGKDEFKTSQEPVAFGLKALKIMFVMEEDKGSTDDLEADVETIEGVNSVEVTDVRRAIG